jgi:hypothetical protein
MAEDTRGRPGEGVNVGDVRTAPPPTTTHPERLLPEEAEAAHGLPRYDDPELARSEIEATRSRMSGTIDEIEERILLKKQRMQDRLNVMAPVRENPWRAMWIALGSGILLGLLTSGGEKEVASTPEPRTRRRRPAERHWRRRAAMLERRSRRLLRIAREQEDEIERMRRQQMRFRRDRDRRSRAADRGAATDSRRLRGAATRIEELGDAILSQLTDLIGRGSRRLTWSRG